MDSRLVITHLAHTEGEIGLRRFNHEWIVVVYQTIDMAEPALDHLGKEGQKLRAVTIITDDVLAGIAPTRDMIDGPEEFKTKRACMERGPTPHNVRL